MVRLLKIPVLLMISGMFFWMAGCGDDYDDEPYCDGGLPAPYVESVVPSGGDIFSNTIITVTFSEVVLEIKITANNIEVPVYTVDCRAFTLQLKQEGNIVLGIEAWDDMLNPLDPPFAGASYEVISSDAENSDGQ